MASQASCPNTCPLLKSGCYAESGPQGFQTARVNRSSETNVVAIAKSEAKAIGKLSGDRPLRLHVVGDATSNAVARILAKAVAAWKHPVWSYTHAWRKVERKSWASVSVLASCETTADIRLANKAGYAAAIVVDQFKSKKAYDQDGMKFIPCPAQTHDNITCIDCKLCWRDETLKSIGATVAFEAHGSGAKKTRKALELIQIGAN